MTTTKGPSGLAFDPDRAPAVPVAAATVLVLRESSGGLEIYCVRRHPKSGFMGGAVVFPGGKLDPVDTEVLARGLATGEAIRAGDFAQGPDARLLAIAAGRETVEEAALLPTDAPAAAVRALVDDVRSGSAFDVALAARGVVLRLDRLVAFARWVTPEAEARRFDARFFLMELPPGQEAANDGRETTIGFWARPEEVLEKFMRDEIQLAPPTTRNLELLSGARTFAEAVDVASRQSLEAVCPKFVPGDPPALVLPGDPAHDVRALRVEGPTRFVLRDGKFVSEGPPAVGGG
jgi:8-oxo-dGTP pyrophosphatase MutT (NUDIX family)